MLRGYISHPEFYFHVLNTYRACNMLKCFSTPCYHTLLYRYHVKITPCVFLTSGHDAFCIFHNSSPFGKQNVCQRTVSLSWGPGHGLLEQAPLCAAPSPAVALGGRIGVLGAHLWNLLYKSEEQMEGVTWKSKQSLDHMWDADVAKEGGRRYIWKFSKSFDWNWFFSSS